MAQTTLDAECFPSRDIRDPRFETLAGRLEEGRFRKQYAFLYEEALQQERSGMKAALKVRHTLFLTLPIVDPGHLRTAAVLRALHARFCSPAAVIP